MAEKPAKNPAIWHPAVAGYSAIRHQAVAGYPAGYPASGIFFEKHPASGKKKQIRPNPYRAGPNIRQCRIIRPDFSFSGKKFGNPSSGSCRIYGNSAVAGYPVSGIFFEKHPASGKKNRSGPTLLVIHIYLNHSQ